MRQHSSYSLLYIFISIIMTCVIIGLLFIYSSSSIYAFERLGSSDYYLRKQLIGLVLGGVALLILRFLPLPFIKRISPWVFCATMALTVLTFIPGIGQSVHGSHRWISFAGFGFQPSEALKMSFIVYLSYLLAKKQYKVSSFTQGYLPLMSIVGVTSLLLLKQPDFGQAVTLCLTAFLLFFVAQCQTKHLVLTLSSIVPLMGILIYMKPYRIRRVLTFLNPWDDPHGSGFQIIQSLIAIGSGNITGVGIAQSKQKFFYLPMQHTDFIFSIIAEETGFIGSFLLVSLFILFLYTGLKIATTLRDPFSYYVTTGYVLLITIQTLLNICVASGLLPTKGLALPFISYGNSGLLCNIGMIGIIINCVYSNEEHIHNSRVIATNKEHYS
ncbi:putative lipid II flippase FtsW [Candidatus Dependentiae bacterium]|nr:putative lipid II flippase FtsW [Candidatus Dependentiae bacterium]